MKIALIAFGLALLAIMPCAQAGWVPCLYSCPEKWEDRPMRPDTLPSCCLEGEQVCSDDGTRILRCGDYDYYGTPIWDFDMCLEFPSTTEDMGYCEYGCKDVVKGVKTSTWTGNIFTGYTEHEDVYEMRSGICYEDKIDCGTAACNYAGETKCGYINVGGVSKSATFACEIDESGCLLWSTTTTQVCENGCYDGKCVEKEAWQNSECAGTGHTNRQCVGDSLCYCMDRDGDGIFNYDRPTDEPTSCIHCNYGCTSLTYPPSCKTETGQINPGCNPTDKRCYGNFIQRCLADKGTYYDWITPVNVLNSDYCEFGCHLGMCLNNPDEEAYVQQNLCVKGETKCIEDNFVIECDGTCDDADGTTWCWGTTSLCPSFMCNGGKCVETIGSTVITEVSNLTITDYYNFGSLAFDGKYFYTVGTVWGLAYADQVSIYKIDMNGSVITTFPLTNKLDDIAVEGELTDVTMGVWRWNSPCSGAIAYYDGFLYVATGTPDFHDTYGTNSTNRTLLKYTLNGEFVSNNSFGAVSGEPIYNLSVCDMKIRNDTIYAIFSGSAYNSTTGLTGGIAAFYLNGTYRGDSEIGDGICLVSLNDTLTIDYWKKEFCWAQHYSMFIDDYRFNFISHLGGYASFIYPYEWQGSNYGFGLSTSFDADLYKYAYLETYGYDNFYYGVTANLSDIAQRGLTIVGSEKIGDKIYMLARGKNDSFYPNPIVLLRMDTQFTKKNECSEGSQQCIGFPYLTKYVECVEDKTTGAWQWYKPGLFGNDDNYITDCAFGESCETYWVNHKIKKAVCVTASCSDRCTIGETKCSDDGLWVQTCAYMNETAQTLLGASIESLATCASWNNTEYCGGYYGANFGYCHDGVCLKKQSECSYTNSTTKASRCTYVVDGSVTKEFVVNCTDVDSDGNHEYDMMNATGQLEYCRYGCTQTFNEADQLPYAQCETAPSASATTLKNTVGDFISWFKILFPDALSRSLFSIIAIMLLSGMMAIKSWELGFASSVMLLTSFTMIGFLPIYTLFIIVGFIAIYIYKAVNT